MAAFIDFIGADALARDCAAAIQGRRALGLTTAIAVRTNGPPPHARASAE